MQENLNYFNLERIPVDIQVPIEHKPTTVIYTEYFHYTIPRT